MTHKSIHGCDALGGEIGFGLTGIFDTLLANATHLFVHFGAMEVSILTGTWNCGGHTGQDAMIRHRPPS